MNYFNMKTESDLVVLTTTLPSYLKELLKTNEKIKLVHREKSFKLVQEVHVDISKMSFNANESNAGELTGCPLEVDLQYDDDDACSILIAPENCNHWTSEEAGHLPMSLGEARKFINKSNRENALYKSGDNNPMKIFCVCDGQDEDHTILLGSLQSKSALVTTQVFMRGFFIVTDDTKQQIEGMKQKHNLNMGEPVPKIKSEVFCLYELYGYNLKSHQITDANEHKGSVLVEASWNSCEFNIPQHKASIKMTLQAVIGNKVSNLNWFWTQLLFFNNCIRVLQSGVEDVTNVTIASEVWGQEKLSSEIYHILCESKGLKYYVAKEKAKVDLVDAIQNMQNMKQENILDNLWNILNHCENPGDLKYCFNVLFEELANNGSIRIHLPEDDKTVVSGIISGIYNGKTTIPNLSFKQSLQLFVELGIEKLKRDYFFIITEHDFFSADDLLDQWNKILPMKEEAESNNTHLKTKSLEPALRYTRKTTLSSTTSVINIPEMLLKLDQLSRIHASLELLLIVEQNCQPSRELLQTVATYTSRKCLTDKSSVTLSNLVDNKLCELTVPLTYFDVSSLQINRPATWHLKLTSTKGRLSVATVFHLSNKPLFPSTIFNNYDIPHDFIDTKCYYFTELVSSIHDTSLHLPKVKQLVKVCKRENTQA